MEGDGSQKEEYVVKLIERKIREDKGKIVNDAVIVGASAFAIGIGILGAAYFGGDVIREYTSDEVLTLGSLLRVKFQGTGVGVSALVVVGGIYGAIKEGKNLVASIRKLNEDKKVLNGFTEGGRSR